LFCFQRAKKALLPQELYRILDGLDRHLRENDEAWLSEARPLMFYRLVYVLLQSHWIAEVHGIAITIFQLDLSLQPSFQRGFKGGSLVKSFRKDNPGAASPLHHLNSFVSLLPLYRAKDDLLKQFDIPLKAHGFNRHQLIMARVSPALLHLESLWNGFHPVGSSKSFHGRGISKQGDASVGSEQTGVVVDEHIDAKSRGQIGSTPKQGLRG
jgi:hypothetical protein